MRIYWLALTAVLAGCAGTSPNLSTPQMQTPTLGGGLGARSGVGNRPELTSETSLPALEPVKTPENTFLAAPYLQLGNNPKLGKTDTLALLWHTKPDEKAVWLVEVRPATGGAWKKLAAPTHKAIAVSGIDPHEVWSATLTGLAPGKLFDYRVSQGTTAVFTARARARRGAKENQRFVVFGDFASGSKESKMVPAPVLAAKPDFVVMTGDLVYSRGRISEYREKFFPFYNADASDAEKGGPLTRTTLCVAAPGNHDIQSPDLDKYPDTKAFFYYWSQPLNGPLSPKGISPISGAEANQTAFKNAAGAAYPRAANFSFDAGNAHFAVLDADPYMDWTDPTLVKWLESDLKSSKAAWKFVAFHHPPFHTSPEHENDQWMRTLSPLFEKYGVKIVFAGHVHNYQRTFPLKFVPTQPRNDKGQVEGTFTYDKDYDGLSKTQPKGIIYVVTGAGGAELYAKAKDDTPEKWQPFTKKIISSVHSFTTVDLEGKKLTLKQLSLEGKELDSFVITQ